jgi:cytochrome c551
VLLALTSTLALGGCGGGSKLAKSDEPLDLDKGRQQFQQTCRACHALADAEAAGVFGPDLDLLQPDAERVREQIESGGGGMPPDLLSGDDADLVARYVAEVAGAKPESEGTGGERGTTKPRTTADTDG